MIHKTAIVDPKSKISSNVEVGPYSVIGPNVEVGENTIIQSHVSILGNTKIGKKNKIYPFASILNPVSGQSISDTISVLGFAMDNHQVEQVQFLINNEIVSTLNDTPYTFQWSTVDLEDNSEHVLIMTAEDQAGNITTAQPVLVNILNP